MLFQHPETAFNPRRTIWTSLKEVCGLYRLKCSREILATMLEPYGIRDSYLDRFPSQISGGELQRIALARVLLPEPEFIVLDEATSMLDVISQARMMRMLLDIRRQRGVAYLLISHDAELCRAVCDRCLKMSAGTTRPEFFGERKEK
jgi:ABC-type dipeptide/oligopeptide/nickel transport system ATPase subunit